MDRLQQFGIGERAGRWEALVREVEVGFLVASGRIYSAEEHFFGSNWICAGGRCIPVCRGVRDCGEEAVGIQAAYNKSSAH